MESVKNISTKRLLLKARSRSDLEAIIKQSTTQQMEEMGISSQEQLELELKRIHRLLETNVDKWRIWDIKEKASEQLIGNCGFHNYAIEHKRAEIGYWLNEKYRKKGFMREAVRSIVTFGFIDMKLIRIEAILDPDNYPSKNLLEFLGFKQEGRLRDHYIHKGKIIDSLIYSKLRSEEIE